MPELKKFNVFGPDGRIGILSAPARFLDSRSEKTIFLDEGGELIVSSAALHVQPDGSFRFDGSVPKTGLETLSPQPFVSERTIQTTPMENPTTPIAQTPVPDIARPPGEKLYREGYSIQRTKIDRLITEPVAQRQEGDTLILPVVEEVLVVEKRMMLREEIRITRSRDEVESVITVDPSRAS